MKIGDKIYCKKTYINNGHVWVTENKVYTIFIGSDSIFSIIDDERDENSVILEDDFDIHFYVEKEIRKLKLEKLYENR